MTASSRPRISVVTPTLRRTEEVDALLTNLSAQTLLPVEFILVDAGPPEDTATQELALRRARDLPFRLLHVPHARGTAIQRNGGIELATGDFIAFIDDDIKLDPRYFEILAQAFARGDATRVGGIVGVRTNERIPVDRARWRLYRTLRLLSTYEPGRYDYASGYPVNAKLQPPFSGLREVDFMTTSCAMWRRDVFHPPSGEGLRFDPFFRDFGVLEDAHLSLRARRSWTLWQCGDAHCEHLRSPKSRTKRRLLGFKSVVNYWYVFEDVAGPLSAAQQARFWRFQLVELARLASSSVTRRRVEDLQEIVGRLEGIAAVARGRHRGP